MSGRWALLALALMGCEGEPMVFKGDWSCEDKPNRRPTYTIEARVLNAEVREVFADPVYRNLITLGTLELDELDGANWIYEGKMPTDLEIGVEIVGQEIGVEESCKDISSILFQVVLKDGSSEDFQVKKGDRGKKQEI